MKQDYPAATEWLDAMRPDDPVRNASIAVYAGTVARHHPETANGTDGDPASKAVAEAFKTGHGTE